MLQTAGGQLRAQRLQIRFIHFAATGKHDHRFASAAECDIHQSFPLFVRPTVTARVDRIENDDIGFGPLLAVNRR